jgi:hypothetical protein
VYIDDVWELMTHVLVTLRKEQTVDQSLLTVDRQMGLVICTPDGKVSFP